MIEELGYQPSATALALSSGRTRTLGLVFPPTGGRHAQMQLGVTGLLVQTAAQHGYDVLLTTSAADGEHGLMRLVTGRRMSRCARAPARN